MSNRNIKVIQEFGDEWTTFDHTNIDTKKLKASFNQYFVIFPWHLISEKSAGFDMGCGSGRWAQFVAPKVGQLNCVEPSHAIEIAKVNLSIYKNVIYYQETSEGCSLPSRSQDFGYSLGVLHHIPDTIAALADCARLLKSGAPFLLYLYYNFDNKPAWYRYLWKVSDYGRRIISKFPWPLKSIVCALIAIGVYYPFSRGARVLENLGLDVSNMPLSDYRHKPFYQCKNDALDRFGTRLEQRFSKANIKEMLEATGFRDVKFSPNTPYWTCVAIRK